ncbi:MAG: hypothetical protein FWD56_04710, partial [Bacteroidales bacterium]|nr:hypothetical protein [Bacteroidales bacterium]
TVEEDGSILFRIGLEQEYTAYNASTKPARYAVVELWYANYTKMQKIYLRQGEGADFLMRTQDAVNSGGYNNATRPSANKFTVYNLTSSPLNKSVGTRGAIPTQYPSQIGAYFQWTGNTNAYAPFGGISPIPSWPSNTVIPANTPWSSSYETCPVGYRRPKDTDDPNGPVMNSEIKQSLWEKPQMGYGNNESNILFGYYADGFYDRRKVERLGGSANANGYVAGDTPEMAWGGRLFYNPVTNASLFFPVGKGRNFNDGVVPPSLTYAHYQTSSEGFSAGRGMALHSSSGDVLMNVVSKSAAYNVRCVKE